MNILQPHGISLNVAVERYDAMGNLKQRKNNFLRMLSPFYYINGNKYVGRSFVGSFLTSLNDIFSNGIVSDKYSIQAADDADNGLILRWDSGVGGESNVVQYTTASDTWAERIADEAFPPKLPSDNTGLYQEVAMDSGFTAFTDSSYAPNRSFQIRRIFNNTSSQKVLREVFLTAKKGSGSPILYSRDVYAPNTSNAANLLPKAEVLSSTDSIEVIFEIIMTLERNNIIVHENFVKYLYNALFCGNVSPNTYMSMLSTGSTGGSSVTPAAATYGLKTTPNSTGTNGLDILLLTNSDNVGVPSDIPFSLSSTGSDPLVTNFATRENTEFSTRTLAQSASVQLDSKKATVQITKLFSGHTADLQVRSAVLFQEDTAPATDARFHLASWNEDKDSGAISVSVNEMLKVIFTFSTDVGSYATV